jgi:hypothetical protein
MKDVISLVITTTCLAVVGLGIYLFSNNNDENSEPNQKAGKKPSGVGTKKTHLKIYDDETINLDDDVDDIYDEVINDKIENHSENDKYNPKNKTKNRYVSKTKKHKNNFTTSKKKYYY